MPARESEAFVLRTYPYREADLIVSFLTRDRGKLRGVARGVRRPKNRYGSGLERLAHIRVFYFERENRDLVRLDRCELIGPPVFLRADYAASVGLDFLSEVSDQLMPEHEPSDRFFRLLALVVDEFWRGSQQAAEPPAAKREAAAVETAAPRKVAAAGSSPGSEERPRRQNGDEFSDAPGWLWRALTYFSLWSVRLGGWLPPLDVCIESGQPLAPAETAYFDRSRPGLSKAEFRGPNSWPLSADSRKTAREMLGKSLPDLEQRNWNRQTSEDLRRFLTQRLEEQFERRLNTPAILEQL